MPRLRPGLQSVLAEVDLGSGEITRHVEGVGTKSHGLVFWDRFILVLDSEGGALLQVRGWVATAPHPCAVCRALAGCLLLGAWLWRRPPQCWRRRGC